MKKNSGNGLFSRRTAVLGGGAAVAGLVWYGIPFVRSLIPPSFAFKPVSGLSGFRQLDAGDVSRNLDPFAGLSATDATSRESEFLDLEQNLCEALFGSQPRSSSAVSVASFSDYRCPYCRILTPMLAEWQAEDPLENHVEWHEWPMLGEPSLIAARAALAGKRQGAYPEIHERLMRSAFVATPIYLRDTARRLKLDADQLLHDMEDPTIAQEIDTSRALAALFGFPGTPALVVGKTVVIGAITESHLHALIDLERSETTAGRC